MIISVTTAKDSTENLIRWTARNLANGVDHMVVFVEDGDDGQISALAALENVTPIHSATWWGERPPARLNIRQRINANAVLRLCADDPDVAWVLHLDADEVALIDRGRLSTLPADVGAFRLSPLEALSLDEWPNDHVTTFKRLLSAGELSLLTALGMLAKPSNTRYFHGHVGGKVAMRPALGHWLGTHHVVDDSGEGQPAFEAPWLQMLHFESFSRAEFIRKWSNLTTSGGPVVTRGARSDLSAAIRELTTRDLDPALREDLLRVLFERHVRDDHEATLRALGLLVDRDPDDGTHTPSPARSSVDALAASLDSWSGKDKTSFQPPHRRGREPEPDADRRPWWSRR